MFLSKWSRGMAEETTRSVIILALCARNSLVGLGTLRGVTVGTSRVALITLRVSRDLFCSFEVNSIFSSSITSTKDEMSINPSKESHMCSQS